MKRILLSFIILLFSYTAHADLESWMGIPIVDLESIAGIPIVDLESWAGQTIPSGGGGGTERLTPNGDGATLDWDDDVADTYTRIDNDWATRDTTDGIASAVTGDITMKLMSDPSGMGGGDTCTEISIDIYAEDTVASPDAIVQVSYSVGSGFIGTTTIELTSDPATYNVTYSGLSLSLTEINALQIRLTNQDGASTVAVAYVLSGEVTYE